MARPFTPHPPLNGPTIEKSFFCGFPYVNIMNYNNLQDLRIYLGFHLQFSLPTPGIFNSGTLFIAQVCPRFIICHFSFTITVTQISCSLSRIFVWQQVDRQGVRQRRFNPVVRPSSHPLPLILLSHSEQTEQTGDTEKQRDRETKRQRYKETK